MRVISSMDPSREKEYLTILMGLSTKGLGGIILKMDMDNFFGLIKLCIMVIGRMISNMGKDKCVI